MKIKKYKAGTVREALLLVKEDLGPDAVILKTRELKGLVRGEERVEVTAALDEESQAQAAFPQPMAAPSGEHAQTSPKNASSGPTPFTDALQKIYTKDGKPLVEPEITPAPEQNFKQALEQATEQSVEPPSKIFTPKPLTEKTLVEPGRPMNTAASAASENSLRGETSNQQPSEHTTELQTEIHALRQELKALRTEWSSEKQRIAGEGVPEDFQPLYYDLNEMHFPAEFIQDIVAELAIRLPVEDRTEDKMKAELRRVIASRIPVAGAPRLRTNRATVLIFVGPTGVGKSTTIAKIAGKTILEKNHSVGIITTDCYRMGAVEQLSTFSKAANIQLETVFDLDELDEALDRLADLDLVLVDTAGRSRTNQEHLQELESLCKRVQADEVHLCLAANTRDSDLKQSLKDYAPMKFNRIVFTKLDESSEKSALYSIPADSQKAISWLTYGQGIPDDLEPANRMKVADWVLSESESNREDRENREGEVAQ